MNSITLRLVLAAEPVDSPDPYSTGVLRQAQDFQLHCGR